MKKTDNIDGTLLKSLYLVALADNICVQVAVVLFH